MEIAWDVARRMPSAYHYVPGRPFNIDESQAVNWLLAQPEVKQLVWNMMKPALMLDLEKQKWRGLDASPD